MPSFIFTISNDDWNGSTDYPIQNGSSSFTNLVNSTTSDETTTTVTCSWDSYTNNNSSDGLLFYNLPYQGASSINITQFGEVPLVGQNTFRGFQGQITATDMPSITNTSLNSCFKDSTATTFGYLGSWDVSGVTSMSEMFYNATNFNEDLSGWDTQNVTNMNSMFFNANSFNIPNIANLNFSQVVDIDSFITCNSVTSWTVESLTLFLTYLSGNTNANSLSFGQLGIASSEYTGNPSFQSVLDTLTNKNITFTCNQGPYVPPSPVPCFKTDTKILCYKNNEEVYVNVQDIRKGDLIKTYKHGYVPIYIIGTSKIYNSGNSKRMKNRLYKCSMSEYPELFEDLYITGCHSILVDELTDIQKIKTVDLVGKIYITDDKYRLLACIDNRSIPYEVEGTYDIWHFALENTEYYNNYGVYANGLLVESSSKRYMQELSGMDII